MLDYLASEVKTNGVRELIGVVNAVIAYSTVYKSDFSLDLLKDTINKLATTQKKPSIFLIFRRLFAIISEFRESSCYPKQEKENCFAKTTGDVFC
jgi:chromosomal replication initiation ATPase DnaA